MLLLLAVAALVAASCASKDKTSTTSNGGTSGGTSASAATCQGKTGEKDTAKPLGSVGDPNGSGKKVGLVFDVGGRGDKSFNDSAYNGIEAAAKNMKVTIKTLEPDASGSNRAELMRGLATGGYTMIIGVGFAFADDMAKIAKDFPNTKFAIVDGVVKQPNTTGLLFAEEQGSFLVGAAAAQASKAKQVGFVGGVETALIKKFEAGYKAGVKQIDPNVKVDVKYLTPDGDFSGFKDPAKGETTAKGLYANGDDVVYHAAGLSGTGVFRAATAADRLAIGVDSNQYLQVPPAQQKCILTSMIKRVDVAVYTAVKAYLTGGLKGGTLMFDLKNGGIDFATQGGQIPDTKKLEDLKQQIIDGKITVPTT
ncbi:MAG: family transporter substrate-binding protein [Acidimicrobiales bacterium]|nr:family transporter substrate-binding protein [Acidimicrobiales bacterium]